MTGLKSLFQKLHNKFFNHNFWIKSIILIGLISLLLGRLTANTADPDLWGYLSFGRLFWNNKEFPYHDIHAYTPTKDVWVYHEWLTGVFFYPLFLWPGPSSLQVIKYIMGLGTALLIFLAARQRGASLPMAVIGLMLVSPLFGFSYSPVRAQIFTYLFLAITIFILERSRVTDNQMFLLWLLPLFLLWANLHGGFIVGLGIIGLYAAGNIAAWRKAWPLVLVLALSTAVTLINPYGLMYWEYLLDAVTMPRPDIGEWQSLMWALKSGEYFTNAAYFLFLFAFMIIAALISRRMNVTDTLLILVTGYLAFTHIRHQSLFFIIAGCLLPCYLTEVWKYAGKSQDIVIRWNKFARTAILVVFLLLIVIYGFKFLSGHPLTLIASAHSNHPTSEYYYPISAVNYIRSAGIEGNMLTEFDWGEYIIWELNGKCRVAIDGRYETVYIANFSTEYFEFAKGGPNWRQFLDKYPHELILLKHNNHLCEIIRKEQKWNQVFIDEGSVLFMRGKK